MISPFHSLTGGISHNLSEKEFFRLLAEACEEPVGSSRGIPSTTNQISDARPGRATGQGKYLVNAYLASFVHIQLEGLPSTISKANIL